MYSGVPFWSRSALLVALDDLAGRQRLHEVLLALRTIRAARLEAGLLEQDFGVRGFLAVDSCAGGQQEKRDGKVCYARDVDRGAGDPGELHAEVR